MRKASVWRRTRLDRTLALRMGTGPAVAAVLAALVGAAAARDNSNAQLFSAGQGGGIERPAPTEAAPSEGGGAAPALTIRASPHKRVASPGKSRLRFAARGKPPAKPAPAPAGAVSLLEDVTLRPGDVVMTQQGLRVFLGSRNFPYRPSDFTTLAASRSVHGNILKTLSEIDRSVPLRHAL